MNNNSSSDQVPGTASEQKKYQMNPCSVNVFPNVPKEGDLHAFWGKMVDCDGQEMSIYLYEKKSTKENNEKIFYLGHVLPTTKELKAKGDQIDSAQHSTIALFTTENFDETADKPRPFLTGRFKDEAGKVWNVALWKKIAQQSKNVYYSGTVTEPKPAEAQEQGYNFEDVAVPGNMESDDLRF